MNDLPLVLAFTGASGVAYGCRLLEILLKEGREVHVTISPAGALVIEKELGLTVNLRNFEPQKLVDAPIDRLCCWHYQDFDAGIASGSFRTAGMVVVPCSSGTLGSIAGGQSTNLIHRAAEVHLKERRKLIVVPRETPLSLIALENMVTLTRAGAVVLPAMPGFYHGPQKIGDLIDFVVGRICDQLGVQNTLIQQWGEGEGERMKDEG